ncbi:MAG: protein kinase [Planctomycetes bacterium]|nr:protein kinase [Planctomycetota bacterium]
MKLGDLVSHYRIDAKIGEGGMGEVFVAQDETLKRKVALKTIRAAHNLRSEARTRFTREARVLSQLDHPHICRIFDYIVGDEGDLIVLELIEGHALHEGYSRLTYVQKLVIAEQITSALVAAHAEGIVHRDLKPGNIMLTPAGGVKVLDFGLACVRDATDPADVASVQATAIDDEEWSDTDDSISGFHTEAGSVFGTVQFMSPEQARADPVGPASDMFSLGLVLQELFTGKPARKLKRSDGLMRAGAGDSEPVVGLPRDLAQLITRMKEVAPTRRPTAVEALARLNWIRATPQRRLRRALIAGVIAVGLIGATKYALDMRAGRVRAEALTERTEDNIRFLVGDLYRKLQPIKRTDLLSAAARRAGDYYATIPAESMRPSQAVNSSQNWIYVGLVRMDEGSLTDSLEAFDTALRQLDGAAAESVHPARKACLRREALVWIGEVHKERGELELAEQAFRQVGELPHDDSVDCPDSLSAAAWEGRALTKLGEIAFARGRLDEAGTFFERARQSFATIAKPQVEERFHAGQVEFWIGNLCLELGDRDAAALPLQRYLEISEALTDEQPHNMNWRVEVAYAHTNLGALAQMRGDADAARREFRKSVDSWRMLTLYDPANSSWKYELADALSWLATSENTRWHVVTALTLLKEEYELRVGLAQRDPTNMSWLRSRAICENYLGSAMETLGRHAEARDYFELALTNSRHLCEAEPDNADWKLDQAVILVRAGRNMIDLRDLDTAESYLRDAIGLLAAEPSILEVRQRLRHLAQARLDMVTLHLAREEDGLAAEQLALADSILHSEHLSAEPEAVAADPRSRAHFLRARLHQKHGRMDDARRESQTALDVLDAVMWSEFSTLRARTYVDATRIVHGAAALAPVFDRFSALGYSPIDPGR